jgi:hypothetical protein
MRVQLQAGVLATVFLAGCESAMQHDSEVALPMTTEPRTNFIGYATMSESGVLQVHLDDSDGETIDYELRPSDANFESMRQQADGIRPGETHRIRRVLATVMMLEDRSLQIQYWPNPAEGGGDSDLQIERAPLTIVHPGDDEYDALIARTGRLAPNEVRNLYVGRER